MVAKENGEYKINYVPLSEIVDADDSTIKYDISKRKRTQTHTNGEINTGNSYEFVWTSGMEVALADTKFTSATTTGKMEYLYENGMTVNPLRAVSGKNSISTNGDNTFRLTIYNDATNAYEGLKVGVPSDYDYFPSFWDNDFYSDTIDISGTTKSNPMIFNAFVLEKTLRINAAKFSREIADVKALDVPDKAVVVTHAGNGNLWDITFNSNYYDNVEFEITDTNGQKYYVILSRINMRITEIDNVLAAEIYYPSTDSYRDYKVVVKVEYKDETTKTTIVNTPHKGIYDDGGNLEEDKYEISGGEGLKRAAFKLGITGGPDSKVKRFYVTIVKKSDSSTTYGGTLAGSGNGSEFVDEGEGFELVVD